MLQKIGGFVKNNYKKLYVLALFGLPFSGLYLYRLGSFNRGDSLYETPGFLQIRDHSMLVHNIALAPIKFLEYLMLKIDQPNSTLLRLVSLLFLGISFIIFYRILLKWYTSRIAIIGTFMLMTSTISLSLGRFTFQSVAYYLLIPSIILMGTWLRSKKYVKRIVYIFPSLAILAYLPGSIILFVVIATVFRKRLMAAWKFCSAKNKILGTSTAFIILMPLIYSLIKNPQQLKVFFGIDRLFDGSAPKTFLRSFNELFMNGIDQPQLWLSGTPVIDIVCVVLFLLGLYSIFKSPHTLRARLMVGLLAIGLIIVSVGSVASVVLLIPIIYIFVAQGVAYLLQNWFTVFPNNPAARTIGVMILLIPLLLSAGYNSERYFRAWHSSPKTVQALSIK